MAHSEDLRKKAIEYLESGHTQRQARETFHICMATINDWVKKYRETGEVKRCNG